MKHFIRDASQVVIAVLITTSMVVVNAQTPKHDTPAHITKPVVKTAPATPQPTPEPVSAPVVADTAPAVETPVAAPVETPQPAPTYGSHEELMAAAGIDPSDYAAVDYIVSRESGWNPDATEPNSGAHGLPQALPYSKTGCGWDDAVCQLQWASNYAVARYGGWWAAQAYWAVHRNW
jgi:hypothetical protein